MAPKRPNKFILAHLNWKIKWVKNVPDISDEGVRGLCDPYHQVIWVSTELPLETQQHVLMHELLHAIWSSHHLTPRKNEVEEDVVSALSGPLVALLSENASLRAFLFPS